LDRKAEGRRRPLGDEAPLVLLLVLVTLLVLLGYFVQADSLTAQAAVPSATSADVSSADPSGGDTSTTVKTPAVLVHPVRDPNRIVIPAIDVDAVVVPVGLLATGDMETPPWGIAGWYSLGPAPGEPGPAVVLAHVDSVHGRDVFYDLKKLEPGDEVFVYGSDGSDPAVFLVDSVETQLKAELPRERIWFYSEDPLIRLITCGGKYDRKWGHYLANVIVYGHLVR
jgi:hypothetical protein